MTIEQFDIRIYDGEKLSSEVSDIIREIPVEIILNDKSVVTIACTGIHLKELAVGFLRKDVAVGMHRHLSALGLLCPSVSKNGHGKSSSPYWRHMSGRTS